ncbi:hypothetical protein RM11_0307 [Bartonella quintana RM-11]|nr:hypothetical protein RM11_0307 [Bartonella quintana RM-11]
MLHAITFGIGILSSTFAGVIILAGSVFILIFVPWLDRFKICSARYRPVYKIFFWALIIDVVFLGWLGVKKNQSYDSFMDTIASNLLFYILFNCFADRTSF